MKKSIINLITIVASIFIGMNGLAATTWTGAVDDNWSTAGNWSGGVIGGIGDSDVIIDGSDSNGVINVDIDTSLNPLTTLVITNAATNIVVSGNALAFEPAGIPGNTGGGLDVIKNEDNSYVHTFNNDIVMPNDGVDNNIWINPGGSKFVFNGELNLDPTMGDNWEFRNGSVTVNNKITCNALRVAWGGTKVISNGVNNAISSVVSVNDGAVMVVDTPAGTNFFDGLKFQHNSNADYTFNNANVIGDSTRIIAEGTKTLTYRFNADEDLGYIAIGSGTLNLVLGESVNTLAFDGGDNNSWASLHITGFRANTIKFGSDSGGLSEIQLQTITAEGESGGAVLDENGYLVFEGPPPVISGEDVVDFDGPGSSTNARPADVESDTGYTWNFSETEPLFDVSDQNSTIYGGVVSSWTVATNYVPELQLNGGQIQAKVNPDNGSDCSLSGMYVWKKEDFLTGSDGTISFTNGNAMVVSIKFNWGAADARYVVKQGGTYYVSDAVQAGSGILLEDPSDPAINWAPVSTNDYSIGAYGPMTFADIEAVGIHFQYSRGGNDLFLTYDDFLVRANVELPPLTEISDVSSSFEGGQMILSWQGTNRASYAVQMRENLVFGDWSNIVENISGTDDLMSVTNATDEPQAFFRTILEE